MSIRLEDLTKAYGEQLAVDHIGFEARQGEILGFLGPNGAGKSTTMKLITGFIPPTEGTAYVDNLDVLEAPLAVRRRIGYLPEHNPLYLDMYVHEFLRFTGRIFGYRGKQLTQRVAAMIAQTGLGPEQHKKIGMLSKGYRQRVGLAQALIHDPGTLILDEPTSGLDPNQVVEIRNLIQSMGREKTILFSSHILSEVEAVADRVIIIHKGGIVQDSPIAELRQQAQSLEEVFKRLTN
jgi:ABC-2 type transport system ATP-binding protein